MSTHRRSETLPARRTFLQSAVTAAGGLLLGSSAGVELPDSHGRDLDRPSAQADAAIADYTLRIATGPVELAPNRIISATTYNSQFPGPLLRFKEGKQVTVDIHNDTDTPEQFHWHGQFVPVEVDGAAEEGTPYIPAHGSRRIIFTPKPAGFRFYHTHVRAGANLSGLTLVYTKNWSQKDA